MKKRSKTIKKTSPIVNNIMLKIIVFLVSVGALLSHLLFFLLRSFLTVGIVITLIGKRILSFVFKCVNGVKSAFLFAIHKTRYNLGKLHNTSIIFFVHLKKRLWEKYLLFKKQSQIFIQKLNVAVKTTFTLLKANIRKKQKEVNRVFGVSLKTLKSYYKTFKKTHRKSYFENCFCRAKCLSSYGFIYSGSYVFIIDS
jgi:hypothetical protein